MWHQKLGHWKIWLKLIQLTVLYIANACARTPTSVSGIYKMVFKSRVANFAIWFLSNISRLRMVAHFYRDNIFENDFVSALKFALIAVNTRIVCSKTFLIVTDKSNNWICTWNLNFKFYFGPSVLRAPAEQLRWPLFLVINFFLSCCCFYLVHATVVKIP